MADKVEIFEVGPRDGLQNEKRIIPAAEKIELVNKLSEAGFNHIEVTSFVSPKAVPQMADGGEVLAGIRRVKGVAYAALTPNMQGYEAAVAVGVNEVAIFASASEGFSQKNINCSIAESFERFTPILRAARHADIPVRGYVSCVTDCPYDGPVAPEAVAKVASDLFYAGCYEVSLGDTLGTGTPDSIARMLVAVLKEVPAHRLAGHFHDTDGHAIANIDAALALGIRVFDTAIGGLGGCPFAPGASGNVATELVQEHVTGLGYDTGLCSETLAQAAEMAQKMRNA